MSNNAIIVAVPKQDTQLILRQSDAILELKRRMKFGVHYGPPYPGSKKETLLKPGAEWLAKRFGLRSHYEELTKRIDFDFDHPERTFILFEYRCLMIDIETDTIVGEAIGSANSREDKYAFRWVSEFDLPPNTDTTTLPYKDGTVTEFDFAVRKAETSGKYGKPQEYWQAFRDAEANHALKVFQKEDGKGVMRTAWQIGGRLYRMNHENPLDILNTLSKMAQKRSNVSSTMAATGASAYFAPGDDEVTDIYVTLDDTGVVDAELIGEVIDDEVTTSQPSASVRGAGVQKPLTAWADDPAQLEAFYASALEKFSFTRTTVTETLDALDSLEFADWRTSRGWALAALVAEYCNNDVVKIDEYTSGMGGNEEQALTLRDRARQIAVTNAQNIGVLP